MSTALTAVVSAACLMFGAVLGLVAGLSLAQVPGGVRITRRALEARPARPALRSAVAGQLAPAPLRAVAAPVAGPAGALTAGEPERQAVAESPVQTETSGS